MNKLLSQYQELAAASLHEATALPFEVYHNDAVSKLEAEMIFSKEWVFACAEQAIEKTGDYFSFTLAGEAIVIVRGQDGELRAMSNNCRHRGTLLLDEGFGHVGKRITCPYHAWTYDDKGELKAVPYPGKVTVDKVKHCLPQFQLEVWSGLLFINLDAKAAPLSQRFMGIDQYTAVFEAQRFDSYTSGPLEHWNANWKLAMENAAEGYHVFKVHKETLETVGPTKTSYYVAGSAEWTITGGKSVDKSSKLMKWFRGDYPEAYDHYFTIILPPSFVAILSFDSLSWIQMLPNGSEECIVRSGAIHAKSAFKEDNQSKAFTEAFFAEDKWICERAQKGMHSTIGHGGKLVEMERAVVNFHQYLASRLFGTPIDDFNEDESAKIFKSSQ